MLWAAGSIRRWRTLQLCFPTSRKPLCRACLHRTSPRPLSPPSTSSCSRPLVHTNVFSVGQQDGVGSKRVADACRGGAHGSGGGGHSGSVASHAVHARQAAKAVCGSSELQAHTNTHTRGHLAGGAHAVCRTRLCSGQARRPWPAACVPARMRDPMISHSTASRGAECPHSSCGWCKRAGRGVTKARQGTSRDTSLPQEGRRAVGPAQVHHVVLLLLDLRCQQC